MPTFGSRRSAACLRARRRREISPSNLASVISRRNDGTVQRQGFLPTPLIETQGSAAVQSFKVSDQLFFGKPAHFAGRVPRSSRSRLLHQGNRVSSGAMQESVISAKRVGLSMRLDTLPKYFGARLMLRAATKRAGRNENEHRAGFKKINAEVRLTTIISSRSLAGLTTEAAGNPRGPHRGRGKRGALPAKAQLAQAESEKRNTQRRFIRRNLGAGVPALGMSLKLPHHSK
jgi:hypothetical protein